MVRKIVNTPDVCCGSPRIDGTRLTCANVILSITCGEMGIDDYLKVHDYLRRDDIRSCATYCAGQRCIDDRVSSFCQGCSLDRSEAESCMQLSASGDTVELDDEERFVDAPIDVWEEAANVLQQLE